MRACGPTRRWCGISLFGGYYIGNVVNLTFGTLGVNDVVAAAMIVAVVEVIGDNFWQGYWEGQMCVLSLAPSLAPSLATSLYSCDSQCGIHAQMKGVETGSVRTHA